MLLVYIKDTVMNRQMEEVYRARYPREGWAGDCHALSRCAALLALKRVHQFVNCLNLLFRNFYGCCIDMVINSLAIGD